MFLGSHCAVLTAGPARMAEYFPIELPFPRALPIKTTDEFGAYARRIYEKSRLGGEQFQASSTLTKLITRDEASLRNVAEKLGFSPDGFTRSFHRCVGTTPAKYRVAHRLAKARSMIRSGAMLADVAFATGFSIRVTSAVAFACIWNHACRLQVRFADVEVMRSILFRRDAGQLANCSEASTTPPSPPAVVHSQGRRR